jgi:hypothetical protein
MTVVLLGLRRSEKLTEVVVFGASDDILYIEI